MTRDGIVIVTGASRGIGASIAEALANEGWQVAGLSRQGESAAGVGYACDMSDEATIVVAVGKIAASGKIAGLVNNAGQHETAPSEKLSASAFESLLRLNTTSVVIASREVYPYLKANGGGLIVNIGSFFDKLGVAENVAYCASKAAVGAVTRCLAVEWARDNIRVVNVAPGYIETDLDRDFLQSDKVKSWLMRRVPSGRPGKPEEVAELVGTLYAKDIGYLTGETIYLDGGQGMNH